MYPPRRYVYLSLRSADRKWSINALPHSHLFSLQWFIKRRGCFMSRMIIYVRACITVPGSVSRINSLPWRAESRIRAYLTLRASRLSPLIYQYRDRLITRAGDPRYIRRLKVHARVANYFHNTLVHYSPSHASSRDVCLMRRTANTFIIFIKELINSHFKQIRTGSPFYYKKETISLWRKYEISTIHIIHNLFEVCSKREHAVAYLFLIIKVIKHNCYICSKFLK